MVWSFWNFTLQAVLADSEVHHMPRKLKTYQTTLGFFDLAVAAPSMKAALEAWGSKNNLFQMGFAKESDDKTVIAATIAKPGVVLRRAVGTTGKFSEHAELPDSLPVDSIGKQPGKPSKPAQIAKTTQKPDDAAARRAALAFEREQGRREQQRRKAEQLQQEEKARTAAAVAKAKAALDQAEEEHRKVLEDIADQHAKLDNQEADEKKRWLKQQERLEAALRRLTNN